MRLTFTLDDVLRAKTVQFGKIYKKYKEPDLDLSTVEFTTNDYSKIFKFKTQKEYNKFLYEDYVFEIFAEATACEKMLDKNLNLWLLKLKDYEDENEVKIDVALSNPFEFNASIGNTCFFLSKCATRIREYFFPADSKEIWEKTDVLVTADPKLLNNKPEGKIAIKIEMDYNKDCPSDYSYDKLNSFLQDENIIEKLFN